MGSSVKRSHCNAALKSGGFIGIFSINYQEGTIKGDGMVGPFLNTLKKRMADGVYLSSLKKVFHPYDLGEVSCFQPNFMGRPGRHSVRFRVYNWVKGCFDTVEAKLTVHVDQSGTPEYAEGFFTDVSVLEMEVGSSFQGDLLSIARHIKEARNLAERNHLGALSQDLARVLRYAGGIAAERSLGGKQAH